MEPCKSDSIDDADSDVIEIIPMDEYDSQKVQYCTVLDMSIIVTKPLSICNVKLFLLL